jgi:excisionase family DNA binding protein
MTVPEVADRLRLSRGTVYKLIRTGVVPAVRLGEGSSSLRVREDDDTNVWSPPALDDSIEVDQWGEEMCAQPLEDAHPVSVKGAAPFGVLRRLGPSARAAKPRPRRKKSRSSRVYLDGARGVHLADGNFP